MVESSQNHLGRGKDDPRRHTGAPPFGNQVIQTMDPKELEFPQESPSGGSERLKPQCQPKEEPGSQEKISHNSNSFSDHTARDCGLVGPHFDQHCLRMHTFCSLFKAKLCVTTLKWAWGRLNLIFLFSLWPH